MGLNDADALTFITQNKFQFTYGPYKIVTSLILFNPWHVCMYGIMYEFCDSNAITYIYKFWSFISDI